MAHFGAALGFCRVAVGLFLLLLRGMFVLLLRGMKKLVLEKKFDGGPSKNHSYCRIDIVRSFENADPFTSTSKCRGLHPSLTIKPPMTDSNEMHIPLLGVGMRRSLSVSLNSKTMDQRHDEGLSPEQFTILFQSAYNDHGRKLRYYAKKFTNNAHDAEDIVATLFADLWAKGRSFNSEKLSWPYLQKAVHNACVDHLSRMSRRGFIDLHPAGAVPSAEEDVIRTEVVAQIGELIDRLPPQTRTIIRKLYYDGMEPGEAADDMRLALSTIYNSRRSGFGLLIALLRHRNIRVWLCVTLYVFGNYRN